MVEKGLLSLVGTDEDMDNIELNVSEYLETKNEFLIKPIFGGVIKLIHSVRKKFYFIDTIEYYSDANLAMVKALNSYDNTKGYKFTTHYYAILRLTLLQRIRANNTKKRALDNELLYLNATGGQECDSLLEDAVSFSEDMFEQVYANYVASDVQKSSKFSDREKDLFKYQYIEDFTLQDIVDTELYASKQTASRASIRLNKKLQMIYGGC